MPNYVVRFNIIDEQNRTTNREVLFTVADEAALLTAAGIYETAYQALMKSAIVDYTYSRKVAVGNSPAAGANIDAGFTVRWDTPLVVNPTTSVPDPVAAILDGQGGIDITDALMTTWFALYQPGTARVNINAYSQPTAILSATLDK